MMLPSFNPRPNQTGGGASGTPGIVLAFAQQLQKQQEALMSMQSEAQLPTAGKKRKSQQMSPATVDSGTAASTALAISNAHQTTLAVQSAALALSPSDVQVTMD